MNLLVRSHGGVLCDGRNSINLLVRAHGGANLLVRFRGGASTYIIK